MLSLKARKLGEEETKTLREKKVGYAFVVGDLLHIGHVRFLEKCRSYCDYLVVGVYADELTKSYKRKPVIPFEQRVEIIRALRCVDEARKVTEIDTIPMMKQLKNEGYNLKYLFHGDDWEEIPGKDFIESIGGKLIVLPYTKGISTTLTIERILREYSS